jgi:hypothetical protein
VAHQPQHEPSAAGELFIEFVTRSLRDQLGGANGAGAGVAIGE